ncbi:hypothetical protein SK128_016366, partial [Halocaridina rubra]
VSDSQPGFRQPSPGVPRETVFLSLKPLPRDSKGAYTPATKHISNKIDNIGRNNVCVATDTMVSICWYGVASNIRTSVLRNLCEAGHRHVLLKGTKPSPYQTAPAALPRRAEQFAVFNIHRDDFSDKVNWKFGEAVDIMCDDNWFVDEEVKLSNGYHWYTHGLPIWPLVNQTLTLKKKGWFSRNKVANWPNYGIATPFYLIPSEIYNSRDPGLAIQKLFAGDFVQSGLTPHVQDAFTNADGFKNKITELYQHLFLDQTGYARKDLSSEFETYPYWLQPLVKLSLQPMLESFIHAQGAPKRGQAGICPDELYVFFHQKPCASNSSCLLLNEFQLILKLVECPDTRLVVGYGADSGMVTEETVAVKTVGRAQSAPGSQSAPSPQTVPSAQSSPELEIIPDPRKLPKPQSKPSSSSGLRCSFAVIWCLLLFLGAAFRSY